jgi:serine/threonine-protein kinase RsbW
MTDGPSIFARIGSSPLAVRDALAEVRAGLSRLTDDEEAGAAVELVLAEILNNICEHAYLGRTDGRIEMSIWTEGEMLAFETVDFGRSMPDGKVPALHRVSVDKPLAELPEGGFGWGLIHHLTSRLSYDRIGNRNCLTFRMRRDAKPVRAA